jgi:flagellar hook-associated protein 3 FlgL
MKTALYSTAALSETARATLATAQSKLLEAQKELATGRHADPGRTLGTRTADAISLRQDHARLQTIADTNGLVSTRLEITQAALQGVSRDAGTFLNAMIAARGTPQGGVSAQHAAQDALRALTGLMNTAFDGDYIFSGINTDVQPVADYFEVPSPASKLAADTAFASQFGFTQNDPQAASITGSAMQTFLDGPFAALFSATSWSGTWSGAADQNIRNRVSTRDLIETSANANEEPIRQLAQAFTMVADLATQRLSEPALQRVLDQAIKMTAQAKTGLSAMQSRLGLAQAHVSVATERITLQRDILSKHIGALEDVDPAEVSIRISALTTQIETSYALTARLHDLSLVNYL